MINKRKVVLFIVGGGFGLIAFFFVLKTILNNQYSSKIPELSETCQVTP